MSLYNTVMKPTPRAPWRGKLYEIIFEADTPLGQLFDIVLLASILISVGAVCLETVDHINHRYGNWLYAAEWSFTVLFAIEYVLRLACVHRPLSYAKSFYGVIDLISFLPSLFGMLLNASTSSFAVIRSFRLLRAFRIMKLIHMTSEAEELGTAVWRARAKIIVFLTAVLITVTIAGTAMYEVERHTQKLNSQLGKTDLETQFSSIPQSIYWAIVTMTTVGYGDIVPTTTLGKILTAILILVGYSLIIVPTGFVSAEMIDSRRQQTVSTQTCSYCMDENHATDAVYCRICGKPLH